MHQRNEAASNLISDGLIAVHKNRKQELSPETFETNPAEDHFNKQKTGCLIPTINDCVPKKFKVSA